MWVEQLAQPAAGRKAHGGRVTRSAPCSPVKAPAKRVPARVDSFHVVHKVPVGDTPYVKAKHVQLVDKDPDRAIALFWAAVIAGDRVDSALKDMAIVMKQQNRPQEAIEAIKSLRNRCSDEAQESLDNVLLDLYKRCGRLDDQIDLLSHKLHLIHQGIVFNGKRTKTARSQGKKFQVSISQEASRILGNLGWAHMQQSNFVGAEAAYRKALSIEADNNKVCNLSICLMKQGRVEEVKAMLQNVTPARHDDRWASDSHRKSYERAQEMLQELEASRSAEGLVSVEEEFKSPAVLRCDGGFEFQPSSMWQPQPALPRQPRRVARNSLQEQFYRPADPSLRGALLATADFQLYRQDACNEASAMVGSEAQGLTQRREQSWFQNGLCAGWSDSDSDHSSCEDYNGLTVRGGDNEQGFAVAGKHPIKWHVQTLQQLFDTAPMVENDFTSVHIGTRLGAEPGQSIPRQAEQILSTSNTKSFNPAVAQQPCALILKCDGVNRLIASKLPQSTTDCAPLTLDFSNAVQSDPAANAQCRKSVEIRVWKPFGVSSGCSNKPSQSSIEADANGCARSGEHNENLPDARRGLSLDNVHLSPPGHARIKIQPLQRLDMNTNAPGLPLLHNAVGKRTRTLTPVKEKTVSAWGCLGFTQSADGLELSQKNTENEVKDRDLVCGGLFSEGVDGGGVAADLCATEMEVRRQRRLKVFREMAVGAGS